MSAEDAAEPIEQLLGRAAPLGLFATDAQWTIVGCNSAAAELTGHPRDELVGRSFATLLTVAGRVMHQSNYAPRLLAHGQVGEVAVDLVGADATVVPVLLGSRLVEDALATAVTSVTPVLERRDYERDLLAARRMAEVSQRQTQLLHDIARSLVAANDLREIEQLLVRHLAATGHLATGFWIADGVRAGFRDLDGRPMPTTPPHATTRLALDGPGAVLGYLDVTAGAADVPLVSPPDEPDEVVLDALVAAIEQAVARTVLLDKLRRQASTDPLTGLDNRRSFDRTLARALAERDRSGRTLSLFYLDLDGFKAVNDELGHAAGDRLLRSVADDLRGAFRRDDVLARLGGDEFAVVVRDLQTLEEVRTVAAKVVQALRGEIGGLTVSASVGAVHVAADTPAPDADLLLHAADVAMYEAKNTMWRPYIVHELPRTSAVAV
ncbi:MAG: diguanylate cyclase [Nitriliruptoraceae bacterium]|nr:diguanylate cyclase [Nitriliruptoraceae bacterium]